MIGTHRRYDATFGNVALVSDADLEISIDLAARLLELICEIVFGLLPLPAALSHDVNDDSPQHQRAAEQRSRLRNFLKREPTPKTA